MITQCDVKYTECSFPGEKSAPYLGVDQRTEAHHSNVWRERAHEGHDRVPVLIAGGSLVGLSTSLFLARLGIAHLLVERHAQISRHPRDRGNNLRTMELFRTAEVEPAIVEAASLLDHNHGILQVETLTSGDEEWLIREVDPAGDHARISPSSWCLCSQNDLEPVLVRAARDLVNNIRFGTELVSFSQDDEGVTAPVRSRSGSSSASATPGRATCSSA
jgi:putative polyketide hydroxylase